MSVSATRLRRVAAVACLVGLTACARDVQPEAAATTVVAVPSTVQISAPSATPTPTPATSVSPATTTTVPTTSTTLVTVPPVTLGTLATTTTTTTAAPTTVAPPVALPAPVTDSSTIYEIRPPSDIAAPPIPPGWVVESIGRSVLDRDIVAYVRPVENPQRRIIVIGGIHGNEPVTPPTVRGLLAADHPDDLEVWLVPEANPDGSAAGTRWNANEVDLNRNFSWDWRETTGGPGPISEPESQALTALVERIQPNVVVWVHQPYGYVSSIGPTDPAYEQAWSAGSGVRVRSGVTQHGGAESWTAFVAGVPSMLIEIASWEATQPIIDAHRGGYEALVAVLT